MQEIPQVLTTTSEATTNAILLVFIDAVILGLIRLAAWLGPLPGCIAEERAHAQAIKECPESGQSSQPLGSSLQSRNVRLSRSAIHGDENTSRQPSAPAFSHAFCSAWPAAEFPPRLQA